MFHKMNKDFSTLISGVKGVHIILGWIHLASILVIRDERNTLTIDSNKKSVQEDSDWKYEATTNHFKIHPRPGI